MGNSRMSELEYEIGAYYNLGCCERCGGEIDNHLGIGLCGDCFEAGLYDFLNEELSW